jgi:hypothetical protein
MVAFMIAAASPQHVSWIAATANACFVVAALGG